MLEEENEKKDNIQFLYCDSYFQLMRDDVIMVDVKKNLNISEAINQAKNHVREISKLCYNKKNILYFVILKGEFHGLMPDFELNRLKGEFPNVEVVVLTLKKPRLFSNHLDQPISLASLEKNQEERQDI